MTTSDREPIPTEKLATRRPPTTTSDREPTMSEDDALARLREIDACDGGDNESHHIHYDDLLVDALRAVGWTRLADAYEQHGTTWWYA